LVLIIQVKRAKERVETEAEVDAGQISFFGKFGQSSHGSSGNGSDGGGKRKKRY